MQVGRNLLAFVRDRTIGLCETSKKTFSGVRSAARRLASRSLVWLKRMGPIGWIVFVFSTALILKFCRSIHCSDRSLYSTQDF